MAQYVIIDMNNKIVNMCIWDGLAPWTPPDGAIAILDTIGVDQTWTYDGKTFTPPLQPDPVPAGHQPLTADRLANILIAKAGQPLTAQDVAAAEAEAMAVKA